MAVEMQQVSPSMVTGNVAGNDSWSAAQQDPLWERIAEFELDAADSGLNFSERVAKENGWRLSYARRVIWEYKRFLFLAVRCPHVVCPSEDVDQVWHMHLTFTRSYWEELCGETLHTPVHHGPSRGGQRERAKYFQLYQQTIASYRKWFNFAPPSDIWPEADRRFGQDLHCVRVNSERHWIIPKPRLLPTAVGIGGAAMVVPVSQIFPNPLDWQGPQFLTLFTILLIFATVVVFRSRRWLFQSAFRSSTPDSIQLEPIEAAWLDGGDSHAISCGLVDLAQTDAIEIDGSKIRPGPKASDHQSQNRIVQLIKNSVDNTPEGKTWRGICRDAKVGLLALQQRLEDQGLAITQTQKNSARALAIVFLGGICVLGAIKLGLGASRGRAIGFLLVGEAFAVAALVLSLKSIPRTTPMGAQVLDRLKRNLMTQDKPSEVTSHEASHDHLLWSAALLGTTVLMATPVEDVHLFTRQQIASGSGATSAGCGASGCGGDGGGGGCGGCGGCGG